MDSGHQNIIFLTNNRIFYNSKTKFIIQNNIFPLARNLEVRRQGRIYISDPFYGQKIEMATNFKEAG